MVDKAAKENAPLRIFKDNFNVRFCEFTPSGMVTTIDIQSKTYNIDTVLWGNHQSKNVALATAVLVFLAKDQNLFDIDKALEGLKHAVWPGRLDRITLQNEAELLIDGAHNVHAIKALVSSLKKRWPDKKWNVCLGILRDKAFVEFIEILNPIVKSYTILPVNNERSLSTEAVVEVVKSVCGDKQIEVTNPKRLISELKGKDNLLTGSLYLIGEVLSEIYQGDLPPVIKIN